MGDVCGLFNMDAGAVEKAQVKVGDDGGEDWV